MYDAVTERVAASFIAGKRPDDMFAAVFFDVRQKAKGLKDQWEKEAGEHLQKTLIKDLKGRGLTVIGLKVSLGQYRGSRFVTSAKMEVSRLDEAKAVELLGYLQSRYSPKYKLKGVSEDGAATYNVR